jgi:hypothetical protein
MSWRDEPVTKGELYDLLMKQVIRIRTTRDLVYSRMWSIEGSPMHLVANTTKLGFDTLADSLEVIAAALERGQ